MAQDRNARFGRYELLALLGRGGMAETWRARLVGAAGVTKPVLIKKVLLEHVNNEDFISMFVREARISSTLSHGNIAQVFEFGRVDGQYFLAMELVDGQPLHRVQKRAAKLGLSQLPVPLATYIALEMCRGLHYAHTRTDDKGAPLNIVHRDISPDNVLISYEGQVKIVDFGIAKARMSRSFKTEPGIVRGKYLYFSPEQAKGREVDARSDVWSTGLVLYEMLCGQPPITGTQASVMLRMAYGEFPSPRQVRGDLPVALDELIMKALSVELSTRYESANAFADALAGFLYSVSPPFSTMDLAQLVRVLFQEDLAEEGRALSVTSAFHEELEVWRSHAARVRPPPKPPPVQTEELPSARDAAPQDPARKRRRSEVVIPLSERPTQLLDSATELFLPSIPQQRNWKRLAGIACGVVVVAACVGLALSTRRPATSGAMPAPEARPRLDSGTLRPPTFVQYPVTEFLLEADRDVIIVPRTFKAFGPLAPERSFVLVDTTSPGRGAPFILSPSQGLPPTVFFLLSGDASLLPEGARLGELAGEPQAIEKARDISLFRLGPGSKESIPERLIQLSGASVAASKSFVFRPDAEGLLLKRGLVLKGLDPMTTYALNLEATPQGAFLHGRGAGPATTVICAQWVPSPEENPSPRGVSRDKEALPLQFLLRQGEERRVRGVLGLVCGFVDDGADGNEGALRMRIDAEAAVKRPPAKKPRTPDVTQLLKDLKQHLREKKYEEAVAVGEKCLALIPSHPECLLLSGTALGYAGRTEEGARLYQRFHQLYPEHTQANIVEGLLMEIEGASAPK
ncbi:serine/threonine protein kinase [Myxococcus sp. CA033]|uniref:protein kinase domain-containing protein n=2 Tax=unclassified Myxococcus TaxID=2648731 RepID=UPI00157BA041|nr:serine/threonine protein kinase [Myxococcus sp. CA033]